MSGYHSIHRDTPLRKTIRRPLPITVIASFQMGKALFLLIFAALEWLSPDSILNYPAMAGLFYIATHGRNISGVIIPILGVYFGFIGLGLWRMKNWARKNLIATSVVTIIIWGRLFFLEWVHEEPIKLGIDRSTVYSLVLLDIVIFSYLVLYGDIADRFKD
jgi:hypothetical protein